MTTDSVSSQEAAAGAVAQTAEDRPEMIVGAAFAAGLTLALILRRIVR